MRKFARILMVGMVAAFGTVGLASTAQAASPTFTVWDASTYEYFWQCDGTAPYTCRTLSGGMLVQVTVANGPRNTPITLGYRIEDITTTAGADYTGTTGSVTVPSGQYVTRIPIPIVNDGVLEPAETLRVRLTSSSVGGDFSDTGIGTIHNGSGMPDDCTLFRPDGQSFGVTCTNRPPTARWQVEVECGEDWPMFVYVQGPIVNGNGTSTASCSGTGLPYIHGWWVRLN